MNKPENLKDYYVAKLKITGQRLLTKGNSFIESISKDDPNQAIFEEVPYEEWNSDDLAFAFGWYMEESDYYYLSWMPTELSRILKSKGIYDKECFKIIEELFLEYTSRL